MMIREERIAIDIGLGNNTTRDFLISVAQLTNNGATTWCENLENSIFSASNVRKVTSRGRMTWDLSVNKIIRKRIEAPWRRITNYLNII